ncbi:MAG: LysE family translocator [Cyanobacteria bacterium P01_C01_bin.120]
MSIELWLAFVTASILLLIIPGPTILTVISYSLAHGRRANLPLIIAVTLGDSTALFLSLAGLGAVLSASVFWFGLVKWMGGLYLLYLGIKLLRKGAARQPHQRLIDNTERRWKLFVNTYLVTALNPKGVVFFVAFLPQFVDVNAEPTHQLWILALTFLALSMLNATTYALFAGAARRVLNSPRIQRRFNLAGGAILSIAGLWALTAKKPS